MKSVRDSVDVTLVCDKTRLIKGDWLPMETVSKLLKDVEEQENQPYKNLRNRMYNSKAGKKYNIKDFYGIPCMNVKKPMLGVGSLNISFKEG